MNTGCKFLITQGARKGQKCGREQATGSDYCYPHRKKVEEINFKKEVEHLNIKATLDNEVSVTYKNDFSFVGPSTTAKLLIKAYLEEILANINPGDTVDFVTAITIREN
jgi:ribosomal protein S2